MRDDIVVIKTGGEPLANDERIYKIINIVKGYIAQGKKVVWVNSAQGNNTDKILSDMVGHDLTPAQKDAWLIMGEIAAQTYLNKLANESGISAVLLDVFDAEFKTTGPFGDARPLSIDKDVFLKTFKDCDVINFAGFHGISENGEDIATLGRGGSDTTAVALAVALDCKCVFIKMSGGIACFDPSIGSAKILDHIDYDESLLLSEYGYRFLEIFSLKIAKKYGVVLEFKGLEDDSKKTIISATGSCNNDYFCDFSRFQAIAVKSGLIGIQASNVKNIPGESSKFYQFFDCPFADSWQHGVGDLATIFILLDKDATLPSKELLKNYNARVKEDLSIITYIDTKICPRSNFFKDLGDAFSVNNINIIAQSSSGNVIHTIVESHNEKKAVLAIAEKFGLLVEE